MIRLDPVPALPKAPRPEAAAGETVVLPIRGMTCASCVAHVGHALEAVPGVAHADVNRATEEATVALDPAAPAAVDAMRLAVQRAGYEALAPLDAADPRAEDALAAARANEDRRLRNDLAIAIG